MLLPYWTHGRIASMEGVYYEASATTPYHFMAAATLAAPGNTSNAVRGVPYRDFVAVPRLGVPWLQLLGVRYLAVHSTEAKAVRRRRPAPAPGRDVARPRQEAAERVEHLPRRERTDVVAPLKYQPVVVDDVTDADEEACEHGASRTKA